ncbi:phage tail tip lysozyme [Aureimonas sp. N4]|uniref:phage tail tip lysozyme n=1 Tax=Aureimonas sp. N4 TaxID=1638165 RepID=UPI000785E23A|nr:phage tail tip lysozyme [Aureimonas sp. N4]
MADLAVLGLEIRSDDAVRAASDLEKLSTSAKKAEKATEGAGKASEQAAQRMSGSSKAVERLLAAIEKVERAVREQNAMMAKMGASLSNAEAQMLGATKAAQTVAANVEAAGKAAGAASEQINAVSEAAGSISNAADQAAGGLGRMDRTIQGANDNVELAGHTVNNLRSQILDLGTMIASGSSPFDALKTQAAQIYEALANAEGGATGALKAIWTQVKGFINPTSIVIGLLGAATVAVRYFGDNAERNLQKAEKAAKSYETTVRSLVTAQGDLGSVMGRIFDQEMVGSVAQMQRQLSLLAKEQVEAKKALSENLVKAGVPSALETLSPIGPIKELFRLSTGNTSLGTLGTLGAEFEKGKRSAESLVEELTKLKVSDDLPKDLETIVDKMLEGAQEASKVEARIKAITTAIREQKREIANDNYVKASEAFSGFLPNDLTQRQQIEKAYRERVAAIRDLQDNPRSMEGRLNTAEAERLTALKEIQRQEDVMRDGRALDLAAIGAQTVAERALLAAKRERLALSEPGANKEEIERKAVAAQTQVYAQAEHEAADALRQSQAARDQADLEGYAAQVAAINAQYARQIKLAQGSEAAVRALSEARDLDLKALDISTRKSLFDGQEAELRQLQAEAGLIGQNDDARRKALATLKAEADLRRQGIPLNSEWGRTYVANAQQISDLDDALGKQQKSFDDLKDAAKDFFETLSSGGGIMDALTGAFGKFANQLASKGFDQLFGGLFGKGGSDTPRVVGAITQAASQVPAYGSSMGVETTFAAPLGGVSRAPLPPLVTGDGFSASKASSVARQSVPAQVWNFFASKGLASHQIAGIMGNARAESAFNPAARGDAGAALGLFQWNDRSSAMKAFVGQDWHSNVQGQLDFAWKELQTSESKAYRALLQATNVTQATEAFLGFERPHGYNTGVRNSHNYSGRVGYAEDAFRQFEGTQAKTDSIVSVSKRDAEKAFENGAARGVQKGIETTSYDRPNYDSSPRANDGLFGARGLAGLQVLGAGVGAFGNGYQSGSPLSGGLSGAFSGYGAGGAISSFLGVGAGAGAALGVVGGAALGIIGGIIGARKKREEAHKQAAAKWAEMQPQYEAFDRSLSGEKQGDLRKYVTDGWGQLSQFMSVGGAAWKMGSGNSTAQFNSTGKKLFEGFLKMLDEFREGYEAMIQDLSSGQGLAGAFAKGRNATKDLATQIKKTRDDIDIAFGNIASIDFLNTATAQQQAAETEKQRADAIGRFNEAAGKYALSLLYNAEKVSDVQQTIDGLRGTAAGLQSVLQDLGYTADDAAKAIGDRLNQAIANVARGLEQNLADRIDSLNGRDYFASVRGFLEEYQGLQRDFAAAGADTSRLPEFFKLQAQSIVDGAELTGDAFADLVRVFPQLSGVVREFSATASQSAKELAQSALDTARSNLDRSYQAETDRINDLLNARRDEANELESTISKLEDFRDQVREFRDSLKLDDNLSTLNARDRVTEAGRQFQELLSKAKGGDEEARGRLTGAAQEYLNEAKGYYQTSTDYGAIFDEVSKALTDTQTTTESALSTAQSQLDALKRQISLDEAQLSIAKAQYDAILGTNEGIKGLQVALAEMAVAIAQARSQGITTPGNTNASQPVSDRSMQYLANNPDVAKAIAAGQTFGALPGSSIEAIIQDHWTRHGQYEVGHGTRVGYSAGGFTGMGGVSDVAGLVHGQEYVMDAASTRAIGVSTLDMMRQTRSLPTIAMPASPRMVSGGNDNRGVEQRLDRLETLMRQQIATTGGGLQRVAEAGEAGARATEQRALAERRSANNKQQAA